MVGTIKAVRSPEISFFPSQDKVQQLPPKGSVGRVGHSKNEAQDWRCLGALGLLSYSGEIVEVSHLGEDFPGGTFWEN